MPLPRFSSMLTSLRNTMLRIRRLYSIEIWTEPRPEPTLRGLGDSTDLNFAEAGVKSASWSLTGFANFLNSFSFLNTIPFMLDSGGFSWTFIVLGSRGFGGGRTVPFPLPAAVFSYTSLSSIIETDCLSVLKSSGEAISLSYLMINCLLSKTYVGNYPLAA